MNGNFHQFFEDNFYGPTPNGRLHWLHGWGCGCLHQTHLDLLGQLGGLQVYQKTGWLIVYDRDSLFLDYGLF